MNNQILEKAALELGAQNASIVEVKDIIFNADFRKACEANRCGKYNRCWTCPPAIGGIDELIQKAKSFDYGLVYQTITSIEDSFDIEGMLEAGKKHNALSHQIGKCFSASGLEKWLNLSAGGCNICRRCAKLTNEPCRHPDEALSSVEAYGTSVQDLAKLSGMNYINGKNTVTYFGMFLYSLPKDSQFAECDEGGQKRIRVVKIS